MNRRLLTAAIVLASFAGTFGLLSWRTGLWNQAPPPPLAPAPMETPRILANDSGQAGIPPVVVTPAESPQQEVAAPPEADPPAPPEAQPGPTEQFLAAQDRAAAHSTRSR